jgi:hypothetical protein
MVGKNTFGQHHRKNIERNKPSTFDSAYKEKTLKKLLSLSTYKK